MKRVALILVLSALCSTAQTADLSDIYGDAAAAAAIFFDPNTGLTAFPTLLVPIGGKYEGMGTAYTALAWDSGFLESNPSGSALLDYTELSFLHNNWIADSNLEGVVYTMRFNDLGIGFGGKFLYVPFTEYDDWGERVAGGYYTETITTLNVSYNFFSSYYFYGVAVGANLKFAYRNIPLVFSPDMPSQSALTGMLDVGALTRLNFLKFYSSRSRNFSVGAVLKNLGPPAMGDPLPTMVTLGVAYSPLRPVTIAYDLNIPLSYGQPNEGMSMAGGLDVVVTDFFSVQSGFRYRGSNPRFSLGSTIVLENVSFVVTYTLDLTTRFRPLDRISVEAKLNLGDRGRLRARELVEEYYLEGLRAFARGQIETAIENWEKALEMDPGFEPATEYLDVARRQLESRRKLEALR